MPTAQAAAESPRSRAAKVANEVERRWPGPLAGVELTGLRSLPAAHARELVSRLSAALPSSADGPTEAQLITDLRRVIVATGSQPDAADMGALSRRYADWLQQGFPDQEPVEEAFREMVEELGPRVMGMPMASPPPAESAAPPPAESAPPPSAPAAPPAPAPRGAGRGGLGGLGDAWERLRWRMSERRESDAGAVPAPEILLGEAEAEAGAETEAGAGAEPGDGAGATDGLEEAPPTVPQESAHEGGAERKWRADVTGRAEGEAYRVGQEYHLGISVTGELHGATAVADFEGEEALLDSDPTAESFALTVQVDTEDFEVRGPTSQPLTLPRTGASDLVDFDVVPLHAGTCSLTGTVHLDGNFVSQLQLDMPVEDPTDTDVTMTSTGRPPDSAATLEPRDITLILEPAPGGGYTCTSVGSISSRVRLPITREELELATGAVQQAMLDVVLSVDAQGRKPFASEITIPEDMATKALHSLARAGARLFQQLFNHPGAGADVTRVGEWLRQQATDDKVRLTVQVVAHDVPVPWALLYLGPVAEGSELSWDRFLGARHVIEQIPFQMSLSVPDQRILSSPILSVGVNANRDIDAQFGVTLVADHLKHWTDLRDQRRTMSLLQRSTRASVVAALGDAATADQIQYFYCHATSKGKDGNPDGAVIQMGRHDEVTLSDLNLDAPQTVQLESHPLVFINACESGDLSPLFYAGFVPYFMAKGARGVIGTECRTPALFAVRFAEAFFDRLLDGQSVGDSVHESRRAFLEQHRNPLGLLYAVHCDADTRVDPALARP